ncbi:MAG: M20/M25/M40 family metallo-hydrolase [Planctomycetes bacterium]|nr:M20/M25/M40 family metallo-hydrolase [Planctomycetota bacterium]
MILTATPRCAPRRALIAVAVLAVLVPPAGVAVADADLDAIRAEDIRADIDILASDLLRGREAGTPGNWLALLYAIERLRAAGIRPATPFGYLQPIEGGAAPGEGPASRFVLDAGGETTSLVPNTDYASLIGCPQAEIEGPILFAGFGIRAEGFDEYDGLDARGRIVLAIRGAPNGIPAAARAEDRSKLEAASAAGAAALLLVSGPGDGTDIASNAFSIRRRRDPSPSIPVLHVRRLVADRILAAAGTTVAAATKRIEEAGAPVRIDLPAGIGAAIRTDPRNWGTANVVGILEGSDATLRDEVVVVGAHIDHIGFGRFGARDRKAQGEIHNGADDNASGVAAVLEIAEAFGKAPERPKRSIVFALFNAEEKGLIGSRYFVQNPVVPAERIVAMVNLDMVSRMRDGGISVFGAETAAGLREILDAAAKDEDLDVRHAPADRIGGASDHAPFLAAKIPAVFLFTNVHADYHRPTDDAERIDADGEVRIARTAARVVDGIAQRAERLRFRIPPRRERF